LIVSLEFITISLDESNRYFYVFGGLIFIVVPVIYVRQKKYDIVSLFRLKPVSNEVIQYSILIGLTIGVVGDELDRLIQIIIPMPEFLEELLKVMIAQNTLDWVLLILGTVVIASIVEEIIFRGFLQVTLERKGDVTRAVILSSLSWALIHANPFWAVQIFVMGIIIGFLAWRTDSVIPGIIAHGLNNLASLIFINYEIDTFTSWYLTGDHVNPIILIPSLLILIFSIRQITRIYVEGTD
jgi:membrane protease YdiL (CAAX protease family)